MMCSFDGILVELEIVTLDYYLLILLGYRDFNHRLLIKNIEFIKALLHFNV